VLDGFVFDKKLNNKYQDNGDLMYSQSEKKLHLFLLRPCTVRNCVFVNGSEGAVEMTDGSTLENCIFFNHYQRAVRARPATRRRSRSCSATTRSAFAWEPKFGEGKGRQGDLLWLNGGQLLSVIDNNIFAFADNHAIRMDIGPEVRGADQQRVRAESLRGGVPDHGLADSSTTRTSATCASSASRNSTTTS
jgi:hypothetical protein